MKRTRMVVMAAALVAAGGAASAHDDASQGVRQMWRNAKSEMKQFFGMRSDAGGSGCPMMSGGRSMMGGGMASGGMMGGGMMGGVPNDQWRERGAPLPADRQR